MVAIWIASAFALGLAVRQIGLPPLVGFLAAGFLLNALGVDKTPVLDDVAHVGVLLLLFTVGLKLRLKQMLRPEIWGVSALQFIAFVLVTHVMLQTQTDYSLAKTLAIAGALAFSSTVLAAKILEEKREIRAFHGRTAIGILIVQDVIAVALLAGSATQEISLLALALLGLPLLRPVFARLLALVGHGELLLLLGAALALGMGAWVFEAVGLSPELGALVIGMLLADHPRAVELGDSLWGLKEIFLVGFFVSIGFVELPTWESFGLALIPVGLIPIKVMLFFGLLVAFGLSARTAFLTGLSLATYSEFGLIVLDAAVDADLVASYWLVTGAIAVALSFAIAAPLNRVAHEIYPVIEDFLKRFERQRRHPDDEPLSLGSCEVLVVGMGRVGTGAYDYAREAGQKVVGLDSDLGKVERHLAEGRRVVYADCEDPGLWHRLRLEKIRVVMLAVPDTEAKIVASQQLRRRGFSGLISATHVFPDEREPILSAGADVTYNYFTEAGVGLAADTFDALEAQARKRG